MSFTIKCDRCSLEYNGLELEDIAVIIEHANYHGWSFNDEIGHLCGKCTKELSELPDENSSIFLYEKELVTEEERLEAQNKEYERMRKEQKK